MVNGDAVRYAFAALVLFSACKQLPTFSGPLDPRLDGSVRRVCEQTGLSFYIRGSNPGAEVSNNQVVVPKVTLVGPDEVETIAIWDEAEKAVLVTVSGLEAGTYAVRIDRFSDHAVREIPAAIVVKQRPIVSQTRFNALCTTGSGKDVVLVGQHLADTEVTLVEGGLVLPSVVNFDGTELTVTLASNLGTVGDKVNLRIASAPDCATETSDDRSVDVTGPPVIETLVVGPTLATLDNNEAPTRTTQVALEDEVALRLTGTNLVSGASVAVVSADNTAVFASRIEFDGTFLEAYFAPGSLSAGIKSVRVDVGGCTADQTNAAEVVSIGSALAIKGLSQNVLGFSGDKASGETVTVELASTPAANAGILFAIDVGSAFVPLANVDTLDKARKLRRLHFRAALPAGVSSKRYDLYAFSRAPNSGQVAVGVLRQAVWLEDALPPLSLNYLYPRTLSASAGGVLHISGCGFFVPSADATSVRLELVRDDGLIAPLSAVTGSSTWASDHFSCGLPKPGVIQHAVASVPIAAGALQPGRYTLRVVRQTGEAEHVASLAYAFTVLSDAPVVSAFGDAGLSLSVARRAPSSAVVADSFGRLFAYVIGGDYSQGPSANPMVLGTVQPTYEFAPIDPTDDALIGFVPRNAATEWPLERDLVGTPFTQAYGAAAIEDGSELYLSGGTANGVTASDLVLKTKPAALHPDIRAAFVRFEALGDLDSTLGTYVHYRFVVQYVSASGTSVQLASNVVSKKITGKGTRLRVNPGCLTGANPAVVLYRAQSDAALPSDDLDFRRVSVAAQSFPTCDGGEMLDGLAVPSQEHYPAMGVLVPLTLFDTAVPHFGAQGVVTYGLLSQQPFQRNMVILGGAKPDADIAQRTVLTGNVLSQETVPFASNPGFGQAFAGKPIIQMTASAITLLSPFGLQAATGALSQQLFSMTAVNHNRSFTNPALSTLSSAPAAFNTNDSYYGAAAFAVGSSALFVGGANAGFDTVDAYPSPRESLLSALSLSSRPASSVARLLPASFSTGSRFFVAAGIHCTGSQTECATLLSTRQLTNTILSATVAP
jgi:hypothetical protein